MQFIVRANYIQMILKELSFQQNCQVSLYLLEGFDFVSKDIGSLSDPYVVVKFGEKVFNLRDKYKVDDLNPKFYESFQFNATFPGTDLLEIEFYDYDDLFGDELIGKTVIDLDDRFVCPNWRAMPDKPIEYREIYHPSSTSS